MERMKRREVIFAAIAPVLAGMPSSPVRAEETKKPREFVFNLARFNRLLLTTDNAGYRLCVVEDSKQGEVMRTSFSEFTLKKQSAKVLSFDWRFDQDDGASGEQVDFIALKVHLAKDPGVRSNRDINYGPWVLTVSGQGYRFDELKEFLISSRISELWTPEDSLVFRGNLAGVGYDDFLHR